jgi:hypothetical protein
MNRISELKNFLALIKKLTIEVTSEKNSIVECIRVRQIDSQITELTTIEPNCGVFTLLYKEEDSNSLGTIHEEYLINCRQFISLLEALDKGGASNVVLMQKDGELVSYTDLQAKPGATGIGNFEDNYTRVHCKTKPLYPGDSNDFQFPNFEEEKFLGFVKGDHINLLLSMLIQFGQFTGSDEKYVNTIESGGRGIEFTFTKEYLQLFAHDKNLQVLLNSKLPFSSDEDSELTVFIEGRHLYRLNDLANSNEVLNIYTVKVNEIPWMGFESTKGTVYIRLKDNDYIIKRKHEEYEQVLNIVNSQDYIDKEQTIKYFELGNYICCNGILLNQAIKAQHEPSETLQEKLVLHADNGILKVYDLMKANLKDDSLIVLEDISEDWIASSINYKFLTTALNSVLKFNTNRSLGPIIKVKQFPHLIGGDLPTVLLFIEPVMEDSNIELTLFCVGTPATLDLKEEIYGT